MKFGEFMKAMDENILPQSPIAPPPPPKTPFKFHEDENISLLYNYVTATYYSHYIGEDNIQSNDLIFAAGHGDGFCVGNIIKYASRYGKKKGEERGDIMKILHYAILLLFLHDKKELKKRTDGSKNQSG
jgi:hypothetical protein